jgi:hypothetical protein
MRTCSNDGGGAEITPFSKSICERFAEEKPQLSQSSMHSHLEQVVLCSLKQKATLMHAYWRPDEYKSLPVATGNNKATPAGGVRRPSKIARETLLFNG